MGIPIHFVQLKKHRHICSVFPRWSGPVHPRNFCRGSRSAHPGAASYPQPAPDLFLIRSIPGQDFRIDARPASQPGRRSSYPGCRPLTGLPPTRIAAAAAQPAGMRTRPPPRLTPHSFPSADQDTISWSRFPAAPSARPASDGDSRVPLRDRCHPSAGSRSR